MTRRYAAMIGAYRQIARRLTTARRRGSVAAILAEEARGRRELTFHSVIDLAAAVLSISERRPTPQNIPQARYLPLPVISRRLSSATRSCAARGVTLGSRAIRPADRIGRATTRSASGGRLEFERRPTNLRSSRRRASNHRSCSFIPRLAASA